MSKDDMQTENRIQTKYRLLTSKELKERVLEVFTNSEEPLTLGKVCRKLKCKDDFHVCSAIDELEMSEEIEASGEETVYDPEGKPILIGEYIRSTQTKTS